MPRKSAKEIVRAVYSNAKAERHIGNDRKVYWLIRLGDSHWPFADGNTEAKAWRSAVEKLKFAKTVTS